MGNNVAQYMKEHPVYEMTFASIYPHYVTKVEKKDRTKTELNTVLAWLTGYSETDFETMDEAVTLKSFFADAPTLNPNRSLITGVICGVRVEDITEPLMQEIRYMDKVVDELAKGKSLEKIQRAQ